jgi:hypothetical protein
VSTLKTVANVLQPQPAESQDVGERKLAPIFRSKQEQQQDREEMLARFADAEALLLTKTWKPSKRLEVSDV